MGSRNFLGGKTDNRDGRSAHWRRTAPERRRLANTDHDRFQGETNERSSRSASTAEARCAHESSGAPAPRGAVPSAEGGPSWLTYEQAARYAGWSVGHLRNLVSAGQIPVYGIRRRRRFRRDMLDLFLTEPGHGDAAIFRRRELIAWPLERLPRNGSTTSELEASAIASLVSGPRRRLAAEKRAQEDAMSDRKRITLADAYEQYMAASRT